MYKFSLLAIFLKNAFFHLSCGTAQEHKLPFRFVTFVRLTKVTIQNKINIDSRALKKTEDNMYLILVQSTNYMYSTFISQTNNLIEVLFF